VHRDQHSTIQMDRLNNEYRPRSDTHHFDPTLSSSGCRPRGRCASAPPGQSCAVRQRIRLWQRRGAARRSRPSVWEERPLLRRESIGMILAFSYINLVERQCVLESERGSACATRETRKQRGVVGVRLEPLNMKLLATGKPFPDRISHKF